MICDNILEAMGNTPIIRLRNMTDGESAEILVKFEGLNVGGSIKTRTAFNMIKEAEKQVQEQFEKGEVSQDQYFSLRREIIDTESRLKQLADEAEKTENAIKDIDEKPLEEVAAAADEAEVSCIGFRYLVPSDQ